MQWCSVQYIRIPFSRVPRVAGPSEWGRGRLEPTGGGDGDLQLHRWVHADRDGDQRLQSGRHVDQRSARL